MVEPDEVIYRVVINHEEQWSIWPEYREIPAGWRSEGTSGTRDECLSHIDRSWTDMRPLSARDASRSPSGIPRGG
jgi:MbtH protein